MSRLSEQIEDIRDSELVKGVQFSILSPENIRKGSVVEVLYPDTYDGTEPKIGGLFDPRMGVIEDGRICATCENKAELCPGHFGHIELALPVYNMQFIESVLKVLRCVCFRCSNLLVDKSNPALLNELTKKSGKTRFAIVYNQAMKIKKCEHNDGCMVLQPKKYTKNRVDKLVGENNLIHMISAEFPPEAIKDKEQSNKLIITPQVCLNILRKISAEDCDFMGFSNKYSRPEWMMMTAFPIPPPAMRPSVRQDNNQRSEDDLTYFLVSIIKDNKQLKQKLGSDCERRYIDLNHNLLQYHVATYMNNEIPGVPPCAHRSQRVLKAIEQREKGKEGRIRGNLMGKRVDFSARSVISVDPNLSIDEFGVPKEIAMNMTYPEIVTKYNIQDMYKLVRNGPNNYPGAKSVKKITYDCNGNPSPCVITLKYVDVNKVVLHEGDVVNRHMVDGDYCIFNRQPSLHRMSMMGMKAKILPGKTFKLNVSVTGPFNADFDGDEMNAHSTSSIITQQELKNIAAVPFQIISPSKCKPIITLVQDTLVAAYLMTQNGVKIYRKQMENLMMNIKTFDGKIPEADGTDDNGNEYWSGRTVYSMILPEISLRLKNDSEEMVVIKNGKYESGALDSSIIGSRGLIQDILKMYNTERCHQFLDETQNIFTRWFETHGFSVGIGDAVPINKDMGEKIDEMIENKIEEANEQISLAYQGLYEKNLDDKLRLESMDLHMKKIASDCAEEVAKYVKKTIPKTNRFKIMAISGAKGKALNLQQIIGIVGQQDIWGSRIQNGFTDRTLPHFHKHDFGLAAKGFVKNSFIKGLEPAEFFFAMMGGRVGMIDTAVKTSETGYISRRLMKAAEDVKVQYDGTVRNASGNVVSLVYGDDNYDPIKLEKVNVTLIKYNNLEMDDKFKFDITSEKDWENYLLKPAIKDLLAIKDYQKNLDDEFNMMMEYRERLRYEFFKNIDVIDVDTFMPFNLFKYIPAIKFKFSVGDDNVSDLNPIYVINRINELCDVVSKYMRDKNSNTLTKIIIRTNLASKMVIAHYKLNKITFDYLVKELENKIVSAFVQPGEMVGPVAAQSLGEANQQLTLNSFHAAGAAVGSVAVTMGVPRMKEIINLSGNMKTPSMNLYLKPEYTNSKEIAESVKKAVEYTHLRDIISRTEIIYEKIDETALDVDANEDMEFMKLYYEFNDIICVDEHENLSQWVLRMEFDRESMMAKNILMSDIQNAILQHSQREDDIQCIISDDNSANLIMRIRVRSDEEDENFLSFFQDLEKHILDMTLRGIKGVKRANLVEGNIVKYDPDGNYKIEKEWFLSTDGSNLAEAMLLDYIDTNRSFTNDVIETHEIFGIEGVRVRIIKELEKIFSSAGVNKRHVSMLSDIMTYRGVIMQIDRHGINRSPDNGVLAKASFEEVTDQFLQAATFAERDNMEGVSGNIMFGQVAPAGTNMFDLLLDQEKLMDYGLDDEEQLEYVPDELDEDIVQDELNEMYEDMDDELEVNDEDFEFGYSLENVQEYNIGPMKTDEKKEDSLKVVDTSKKTKKIKIKKK
jgi:DNA-directed RNA polymerase II subunit RPB1